MYRDDADAARLRIQTLEAKLAEQDAGLVAREAEIAELRSSLARLGDAAGGKRPRSRWRIVGAVAGGVGMLAVGAGALLAARPSAPPAVVCDVYLARLETCGDNPAVVAAYQKAAAQMRAGFKDAARTPEGRAALTTACTQGLAALDSSGACKVK